MTFSNNSDKHSVREASGFAAFAILHSLLGGRSSFELEILKLLVVLIEFRMFLQGDEELCFLCVSFNGDGFSLDLLEDGVFVSTAQHHQCNNST